MTLKNTAASGCNTEDAPVLLSRGGLVVKTLVTEKEIEQAYHLRHRIFCKELKWIEPAPDGRERDVYDRCAVFFGVLDEAGSLLAFLRLLMPEGPFMLEHEFRDLVGGEQNFKKESNRAEVSRLCIVPEKRSYPGQGNFSMHSLSVLLYDGVYCWCLSRSIRYLYFAVEYRFFRLLRSRKFPCRLLGAPRILPDGVKAVAAFLDWREYESANGILTQFNQALSARF